MQKTSTRTPMLFKLEKPDLSKIDTRKVTGELLGGEFNGEIATFVGRQGGRRTLIGEYLYWDKLRYQEPSPVGVSKEELWVLIKFLRETQNVETVIKDKYGKFFTWFPNYFGKLFHELDTNAEGEIFINKLMSKFVSSARISASNKQQLIMSGIMEEAIASSQLEGAATSREVAKAMLRAGRKPTNQSEQMIANNYQVMKAIEEKYKDREMSMDLLLELHGLLTHDTVDSASETPRMRKSGEPVYVTDSRDAKGIVYHEAPDAEFVQAELVTLIKFANDEVDAAAKYGAKHGFLHPIIKAIMLHFWIGYLHPFTDGNGRLARVLFYWYLIKKGYWIFAYLSLSKIIKESPQQYIMAYVYSEQDDNDLNYFIDYNIRKITQALEGFAEYLTKKFSDSAKMQQTRLIGEMTHDLNSRQIDLLQHLYNAGIANERTSLQAHMNINQVTKMTASKDLKGLVKKGFLTMHKRGRNVYYFGTEKIKSLF